MFQGKITEFNSSFWVVILIVTVGGKVVGGLLQYMFLIGYDDSLRGEYLNPNSPLQSG